MVPQQDKTFGIEHLKPYMNERVSEKKLFDEIINTGDWWKHDLTKCLFGDVVLCLGLSRGAEGERAYGDYLYKLITGFKPGVKTAVTKIHPQARAGTQIPYTVMIYQPFVSSKKLPEEDESYYKKYGINLIYVRSALDLENKLKSLNQ